MRKPLKIEVFAYINRGAERARFELAVEFKPYDGLANRWFQPLTHLSVENDK
jgi:hypothetical protein